MKKILNISVIAALAILPMAANATPVAGDPANIATNPPSGQNAENVTASAAPKYQLAEANEAVDGVVATAGYVKGAYNAAIKAINKVSETANGAVQSVTEGSTNGTILVDETPVAVHGLGSAAYTASTAYDAAGTAAGVQTAIEGKLDDGASGYDIDAKTLKVGGQDVLTGASLTDYAKKTGVTNTISASSISGTVPTVTTWGTDATGTAAITASITGATYTETASQQGEPEEP